MPKIELGTLAITDGTTRVDLLHTFNLVDWIPQLPASKGGGLWGSSPFSDGSQLILKNRENIIDTFELQAKAGCEDILIANTQDIRDLLEKGVNFWATDWQNEMVWIEARGIGETNTRYSIINDYSTPNDGNPYSDPYVSSTVFENWTLILNHGFWLDNIPGEYNEIECGNRRTYEGRVFGNVDSSENQDYSTEEKNVWLANKHVLSQLAYVFSYDASPVTWSSNLLDASLPFDILPTTPAVGDIIYFGSPNTATGKQFSNIIFDIIDISSNLTIVWEYWNGSWTSINVQDNTANFVRSGPNGVFWMSPSDWTNTTVNSQDGYWIRARISSAGSTSDVRQGNKRMYSVNWPFTEIEADQLGGNLKELLDIVLWNDAYDSTATPTTDINRVIVGARSVSRGTSFSAFLNFDNDVNHSSDVTCVGSSASFVANSSTPTPLPLRWSPGAVVTSGVQLGRVIIAQPTSNQYHGEFRVFLRVIVDTSGGGSSTDFSVDARFFLAGDATSTGIITEQTRTFRANDLHLLDMGQVKLNIYESRDLDIVVHGSHHAAANSRLWLVDVILIPVDEFAIDTFCPHEGTNGAMSDDYYVTIRSATEFRRNVATENRDDANDQVYGYWRNVSNGKVGINNAKMRLWFLSESRNIGGTGGIVCEHENAMWVQLKGVQRYLGMRGAK